MKLPSTILTAALSVSGAQAAITLSDNGTTIPTGFATGLVNTTEGSAAPFTGSVFGWDEGEVHGQVFSLDSEIVLGSVYIAYTGFNDPNNNVEFTISVDAGNNGNNELVEAVTVNADDFTGNSSTFDELSWMEFDLSANAQTLSAGQHRFSIELTGASNPVSWNLAPFYNRETDLYPNGFLTGVASMNLAPDAVFAVSAAPIPEPSSALLLGLAGLALMGRRRA